ncbi:hypothetical protein BSKO_10315 [Bryopsis sp. KO-2023]|nr:hypothetical protein BSKO_10315 [Bryopsis sp. KO-2023]
MPIAAGRKRPKRNRSGKDFKEEIIEQAHDGTIEVNLAFLDDQEISQLLGALNQPYDRLTTIRLGYNPRGNQDFKSLEPALLDVDLQRGVMEQMRSNFTPRSRVGICTALANALGKSPIQELEIGLDVTQQGLAVLGEALSGCMSITKLSFAGSLIADGIEGLKTGLMENTSLMHLDLSRCDIGNSGARSIAASIKAHGNEHMRQLWKDTLRDYPGANRSSEILPDAQKTTIMEDIASRCGGLVILNLSQNKIGFQGAIALRDALGIDWRMTSLNLSQNLLTDSQVIKEINLLGNIGADELLTKDGNTEAKALGKKPEVSEADVDPCEAPQCSDHEKKKSTAIYDAFAQGAREETFAMQIDSANNDVQMEDQQSDYFDQPLEADNFLEGALSRFESNSNIQQRGRKKDESGDLGFSYIINSLTQVAEHLEALTSPQGRASIPNQQSPTKDETPAVNWSPRRKFNFKIPEKGRDV